MVYAIRPAYEAGNMKPVRFFGIMSSVLISVALLPQYWEIYKHGEVVGISIPFMLIDLLGGEWPWFSFRGWAGGGVGRGWRQAGVGVDG